MKGMGEEADERTKLTLFINSWESYCGNCGEGASPSEQSHATRLPGYSANHDPVGCGVAWRYVSSDYGGFVADAAKAMRPDLEWWS